MIFLFILLICIIVILIIISLFAPDKIPWHRPHLILEQRSFERSSVGSVRHKPTISEGLGVSDEENGFKDDRIERLEYLLQEKNIAIDRLQKQLNAEKSHRAEFENIKDLLDQEILKLRSQNKKLKGE